MHVNLVGIKATFTINKTRVKVMNDAKDGSADVRAYDQADLDMLEAELKLFEKEARLGRYQWYTHPHTHARTRAHTRTHTTTLFH